MKTIAGIDLGTTYSALAVLNSVGKPEVIPDLSGERLTPSVVWFPEGSDGTAKVGIGAKRMIGEEPERIIQFVKRRMGEPSHRFKVGGREWSPVEISALILRKLKEECIQGGEVTDAVITVPAHFDEVQRKSTMDAGALAGLNVLGIINEPTAAALYYATQFEVDGRIMVYDLGGGTFDVTIMEVRGKEVRILTSKGDGFLGGIDFDRAILRHYSEEHRRRFGTPMLDDRVFGRDTSGVHHSELQQYHRKLVPAEQDKRALSIKPQVRRNLTGDKGDLSITLTRAQFEEMIGAYVSKTEMLVETALEDARLRTADIGAVVLVGGSTRIPAFSRSLQKIMGFAPKTVVNVDEAVALGAAISAGLKLYEAAPASVSAAVKMELSKTRLTDVCNHYFGVLAMTPDPATKQERLTNCVLLRKNTPLPCNSTRPFCTVRDNQDTAHIEITQSAEEETDPKFVRKIGEFQVPLPPGCRKGAPIEITYTYNTNQRLSCEIQFANNSSYRGEVIFNDAGNLSTTELNLKAASLNAIQVE